MRRLTYVVFLLVFLSSFSNVAFCDQDIQNIVEDNIGSIVLIYNVESEVPVRLGAGFIIKSDGTFVTNYHLLHECETLHVKLMDGDSHFDISIIDVDPVRDIAILKFKGFDMQVARLGNSNDVSVGEKIVVIGMTDNFDHTVSDGIVNSTTNSDKGFKFFQISIPETTQSDGSAIFNMEGEVIGISNSISVNEEMLNIAMPINYARGMNIDAPPTALGKTEIQERQTSVFGGDKKIDNQTAITKINYFVETSYALIDHLFDVAGDAGWFYRFIDNKVVERHPVIFEVTDRYRNLMREVGKFNQEISTDKELKEIFDDYAYLFNKAYQSLTQMVTSVNTDGMDFANVSLKSVNGKDIYAVNRKFNDYVVNNYPDLGGSLLVIIRKGPRPSNPRVAYGIQMVADNGVVITEGDGKYFRRGDVVLGVEGGENFEDDYDFCEFLLTLNPGDKVFYRIWRDGKVKVVKTKIGKR